MDRRTFLIRSAGIAGALALGGCASTKTEEGTPDSGPSGAGATPEAPVARPTLRLPGGDQGFPSPFAYMRGGGYIQSSLIYDTLMWKDGSGKLIPWLATGFKEADGGRLYTFELRDGVTWHDGRPLTAEDVAFTFEYFRSQTISPQVIVQPLATITEVKATGPRTVEFRLSSPDYEFLGYSGVGSVLIVPKHIWSSVSNAAMASDPAVLVGSGPYKLQSYTRGEGSYLYQANDSYFLGRPFVERLEYRPVGNALNALIAGDVDAAGASGVVPAVLAPFRSNPDLEVLEGPPGNSGSGLFWNLAKGGALADVQFRRACARAIDRDDMVKRLFGGNGTPGNPGWIPPANPFHAPVEQYPFDRNAAEALLDSAGYRRPAGQDVRQGPDGQPLRFSLLVTNPVPPVTEIVVSALKEVGVELTPQGVDTPTFNQRVIAGNSEMSIIGSGGMNTDHGDGGYLQQVYSSKTKTTQHAQGYVNPTVDQLIDRQQATIDVAERKKIVAEIQRLIAADLPLLQLFYANSYSIFKKASFDQWYYTPGGVGSTVPTTDNKHVFITGRKTGLDVRPTK
ncbi:MAG: ABC transporter substrate-binding protein [Acidimicrobiales bacterium]